MDSFQSLKFSSLMLQLPELHTSDNTQLVLCTATCLVVLVVGVITRAYIPRSKSGLPLPPSPPTWRFRGHFLPPRNSFVTIAEWIDQYGPLITMRSGTEKIVIIGRHNAAVDIMEKQGGILADRPRMIAAGEMLTGGLSVGFAHAGDRLRRMRRMLHTHLQPKAAEAYQPLQTSHAKNMVLDILNDPHNFRNHAITYAATTIMKVAFGKNTPTSAADPEVVELRQAMAMIRKVMRPDAYLVDSIPWLKYIPWYGQELKDAFERNLRLHISQLNRVKEQIQSNMDVGPSFAKFALENAPSYNLTEIDVAFIAGTFFAGGSDTTSLAMCTVLMAAACFPEEQAKVQAELDAVIGRHRAPTFADQEFLPRLAAFISEALRWRPIFSNGVPHCATEDVIWGDYCIPAGTTVFGNHWAISRDPEVFPEPHAFKPQRWLNDQGHLKDDLKFFVYGFGRRVCPGQHIADRSLFINSVLILWAFQLTLDPAAPLDDMGYMNGVFQPCTIEFKTRVPEAELRHMMQNDPEVA